MVALHLQSPHEARMRLFVLENGNNGEYSTAGLVYTPWCNFGNPPSAAPSNAAFLPGTPFLPLSAFWPNVILALLHLQWHCIFATNCSQHGDATPSGAFSSNMATDSGRVAPWLRLGSGGHATHLLPYPRTTFNSFVTFYFWQTHYFPLTCYLLTLQFYLL